MLCETTHSPEPDAQNASLVWVRNDSVHISPGQKCLHNEYAPSKVTISMTQHLVRKRALNGANPGITPNGLKMQSVDPTKSPISANKIVSSRMQHIRCKRVNRDE